MLCRFSGLARIPTLLLAICLLGSRFARAAEPADRWPAALEALQKFVERERRDKDISAISVALVVGDRVVWQGGFGMADPARKRSADADTVYRVGSVSKLFTDIAVMQLVERGELDLDAPVDKILPDFTPRNPYPEKITLRQLMSHRAGLVRESPVGNYFDATSPSLADTVHSLNQTELPLRPTTATKYSNAGVAVVGYSLEQTRKKPFADCLNETVLQPLGLKHTAFEPGPTVRDNLAQGEMWTYDGRKFPAPPFLLGTAPAGNLYSSASDLAKFLIVLFRDGRTENGMLLKPGTLRAMLTPQFAPEAEFGLGFHLSKFEGHPRIGHGGAVYGFSTEVAALTDEKIGAVVIASKDVANGTVRHITDTALRTLLALQHDMPLPTIPAPGPIPAELASSMAGRYAGPQGEIEVQSRGTKVMLPRGSYRRTLRSLGSGFVIDDEFGYGPEVARPSADELVIDGKPYRRVAEKRPEPCPERFRGLIGEYGWDHNTLYIYEADGRLWALIEWFFHYPLQEISPNEFAFPKPGLYHDERIIFQRDEHGRATHAIAASVDFPRRPLDGENGRTFRIKPLHPVSELRTSALAAQPPAEKGEFRAPELTELIRVDPTIKLDIRYASDNNFLGVACYEQARAFLQRPAADALTRVQQRLKPYGYGVLVHDGYRPWFVTKMFYDATPPEQRTFVADPAKGSKHNRGSAVDLSMYSLADGKPVEMVSGYDEFSPRAFPDYPGGTALGRWNRELLRRAMEAEGFSVNEYEWWHFDHRDWRKYPILNLRFEELGR
ncbi:MAG TPA: serine hydrolase [Planctomycetaceae bacterium]|nr:serine hydrolase [Planctomycetaceae bacterium]